MITGTISLDDIDFVVILDKVPTMTTQIRIPLFGEGEVIGLCDGYKGTNQTWVMVRWRNGETLQFQYRIK